MDLLHVHLNRLRNPNDLHWGVLRALLRFYFALRYDAWNVLVPIDLGRLAWLLVAQ